MSARDSALPAVPVTPADEVVLPASTLPTGTLPTDAPVDVPTSVAIVETAVDTVAAGRRRRPPHRRPALYLAAAVVGGVLVNVLLSIGPPAQAEAAPTVAQSVSVAQQLGLTDATQLVDGTAEVGTHLGGLEASRAQREADEATAAQAQSAADQAALDAQAVAAAQAAAAAAQAAAAAEAAALAQAVADAEAAAAAATPDDFHDYALAQLGGDAGQFSCLENLWGKESDWNPTAQNPTSTAYGIPQFLNSTWAGTGIAKTENGFRQIDAGLIYIDARYGNPCGAWSHSQAVNWY